MALGAVRADRPHRAADLPLTPTLGPDGAGLAAGLATAAAIVGRLAVGWAMPAGTDRRRVAVLSLLIQAVGCGVLMLAEATAPVLLLGAILVGLGIGNATSLPPLIAQVEFAPAEAPRVVALIVAISQGAYAFAPAAFGLLRQTGSDRTVFVVAIVIQVAAAGAYLAGIRAHTRRGGTPAAAFRDPALRDAEPLTPMLTRRAASSSSAPWSWPGLQLARDQDPRRPPFLRSGSPPCGAGSPSPPSWRFSGRPAG